MEIWLILVVIAVALAPLMHFMPTKEQQRVARMREAAAVRGLFVEFRKLPEIGASAAMPDQPRGQIIYYGLRLPPPRGRTRRRGEWLQRGGEWSSRERGQPLPPEVAALELPLLAAGVDEASCGVYWQEAGDVPEVEQIVAALEAWSGRLRAP